ncbi:MAG: NADH-quinone oxidoreductase subunit L [bacterium]
MVFGFDLEFFLTNAWLIPALPAAAFVLICLFTLKRRNLSVFLSLLGIFFALVFSLGTLMARLYSPYAPPLESGFNWLYIGNLEVGLGLLVDNLAALMLALVSLVALLIQIYSAGYMKEEGAASFSRYYAFMSLFAASMLTLVVSPNLVQAYMAWELVGVCSYLLIGFWYQKKAAADAAKKAFIVTRFGDLGLLAGIILLATNAGTFDLIKLGGMISGWAQDPALGSFLTLCALLVFCGAAGKSAQFPLHIWLPDAMEGPTPVSALIHAATMVAAGVFLVARLYILFQSAPLALLVIAYIGAVTAALAATLAVVQNDIKRVLAYSTVSQLGYMMLALGLGGYLAGTFHLMTHAFFKALLFLCAGSVIHVLHTNDMRQMGGLGKKMPLTGLACLVGCLCLAGIPPFSGFWSKDEILSAAWAFPGHPVLKILAFATVFLTAFYIFRMYYLVFSGKHREDTTAREAPPVMSLPVLVLALLAAGAGLVQTPWFHGLGEFLRATPLAEINAAESGVNYFPLALSLGLAILGLFLAFLIYRMKVIPEESFRNRYRALYAVLENKYGMDDLFSWLSARGLLSAASLASLFDRKILDRLTLRFGDGMRSFGEAIRREQTGYVQFYALVFLLGALALLLGAGLWDGSLWPLFQRPFDSFLSWLKGGV